MNSVFKKAKQKESLTAENESGRNFSSHWCSVTVCFTLFNFLLLAVMLLLN